MFWTIWCVSGTLRLCRADFACPILFQCGSSALLVPPPPGGASRFVLCNPCSSSTTPGSQPPSIGLYFSNIDLLKPGNRLMSLRIRSSLVATSTHSLSSSSGVSSSFLWRPGSRSSVSNLRFLVEACTSAWTR